MRFSVFDQMKSKGIIVIHLIGPAPESNTGCYEAGIGFSPVRSYIELLIIY
jgi:hypothetical protein